MKTLNEPLVSVIMNCYNSSEYLNEALESVISQTYSNWEIIFWDNQSTDQSPDIFQRYNDARFKYFRAGEHTSLSTARNYAVEKASGNILAFLDCDDIWLPHKLEEQVPGFKDENVGIVYSNFELLLTSSNASAKKMQASFAKLRSDPHGPKSIYHYLLRANFIIFSSVLIKKAVYHKVGGFSEKFSHNEDYEVLLKCSAISNAVCTASKTLIYRVHGANNSYNNTEIGYLENRIILNALKSDKRVESAININEARYLLYLLLKNKKIGYLARFCDLKVMRGFIGLVTRRLHFVLFKKRNLS